MELFILTLLLNGEPFMTTEAHFHSVKQCEDSGQAWLDWLHQTNPSLFEWNDYEFTCEKAQKVI